MADDVMTEFQKIVVRGNIMEIFLFLTSHDIPKATVTVAEHLKMDFKMEETNGYPSMTMKMYKD